MMLSFHSTPLMSMSESDGSTGAQTWGFCTQLYTCSPTTLDAT